VHCGAPVSLLPYLAKRSEPLERVTLKSFGSRRVEVELADNVAMEDDAQIERPLKKMMA